ncbi:MAG TPA: PhnD/SsuA/transferrin family substrate-binding protein [Casimicrobiaceae bacterium]
MAATAAIAIATTLGTPGAFAQAPDLVFSVTEGVTYQATPKEIRDKFEPLAEALGRALKRNVRVVLVPSYNDERAGLAAQQYDIAYIHPAHVALEAIKTGHYKAIAWTTGYTEYTAAVLGKADTPLGSFAALKGHSLVTPERDSITWAMVNAMLRNAKFAPGDVKVMNTRYQDAVPFYIDKGFADYGVTASNAVIKQWTDKGGKVYAKSVPVPIKQIIGSTKLPAADLEHIRDVLVGLAQNDAGQRVLAATGYKGFVAPDAAVERRVMEWLGI